MGIGVWIAAAVALLFVAWRVNIARSGVWIDLPPDPHVHVRPELVPIVDWLAKEAEAQIGRDHDISGNAFALSSLSEAVDRALAEQHDAEQISIGIPELIHDADGVHGFQVTVDRTQLARFHLN